MGRNEKSFEWISVVHVAIVINYKFKFWEMKKKIIFIVFVKFKLLEIKIAIDKFIFKMR
jgi:hypothetical protein